jgi:hypothetical protein
MFRGSVVPPHLVSNSQIRLLALLAPQDGETSLLQNLDNILPLDQAWHHRRHSAFRKQNIGIYQNKQNRRIPKDRREWEDLQVDCNIVFKTWGKQWACSKPSFDRKKRKEIARLSSSGNCDVSSGRCTRRFTGIAGLIPQILQLQAKVNFKNSGWCHMWGKCTRSFARISVCFCNQSGGGANIYLLT